MSEEIINLWKEKTKGIFNILEYKRFWDYIENLQEEKIQEQELIIASLQQKIDKAIEYIITQVHRNQQFYEMDKDNLLEILGDKE